MGVYIYAVTAKSFKAKQFFDHEKLTIRLAKFLNRATQITTKETDRAEYAYCKKGAASHVVIADDSSELYGRTVYEYEKDGTGIFADGVGFSDRCKAVGIILGKPRSWYVETNKKVIENLRRQNEYRRMKMRKQSIGEHGYDFHSYEEYLHQKDKEAITEGEDIFFRGYCI